MLTQTKKKFRGMALSKCRDEIIYTSLSTCVAVVIIMLLIFILYIKTKRRREKGHRKKGSDIEGKRNKVFENDSSVEADTNFKSQLPPRKKASTHEISTIDLTSEVIPKDDQFFQVSSSKNSSTTKCVCTQTETNQEIEDVTVEKKNFNSSGLEFASAGIFIRNIDMNEIFIKAGNIKPGDEVLAINGVQMAGLNDMEAFSHYARSGPFVKLTISKNMFVRKLRQHEEISKDKNATSNRRISEKENTDPEKDEKSDSIKVQINHISDSNQTNSQENTPNQLTQLENKLSTPSSSIQPENGLRKFDINQNVVISKAKIETIHGNQREAPGIQREVPGKQHGKSRSAEEHSTGTNGYINDYNKINSTLQSQNLLVAASRLNKSFDTNGSNFDIQNRYFKRARSEENLRPTKSNSFSRTRIPADMKMSYEDYVREIALLQATNSITNLSNDNLYTANPIIGEKVVLHRGYNQDYISPVNGNFNALHFPIIQQPISRVTPQSQTFAPYSISHDNSECLDCALKQQNSNENFNYASYDNQFLNPCIKADDNGLFYQNKEKFELDPDVMRYMTQKYSEPRLYRKDPPPYTSTHNTITQTVTSSQSMTLSQPNLNVECTVIKRHPQKKSNRQRPHSYTEAAILKKENQQKTSNEDSKEEPKISSDLEKRKHPKRAHSMPAVKHLEGRPQVAKSFLEGDSESPRVAKTSLDGDIGKPKVTKTFLENESKLKSSKKTRQRNKKREEEIGRRKSIDSGTLQKLASEIKNDPSLEDEFPFISKLLGGERLSPYERRNSVLFRHKSTEDLCSQF